MPHNHRVGEQPALLILRLHNGHLMVTRLNRADNTTLTLLNRWYSDFFHSLMLLQGGNLDYIAGKGVIALHRDLGEPWHEHQPQFFRGVRLLEQYVQRLQVKQLYFFANHSERRWCERNSIP